MTGWRIRVLRWREVLELSFRQQLVFSIIGHELPLVALKEDAVGKPMKRLLGLQIRPNRAAVPCQMHGRLFPTDRILVVNLENIGHVMVALADLLARCADSGWRAQV